MKKIGINGRSSVLGEKKTIHREPLTSDLVFKAVFASDTEASKQTLIGVLNLVLKRKDDPITDLTYLNPFSISENIAEKNIIMDIRARSDKGESIDIEMQVGNMSEYINRSIYYACKQLVGELQHGDRYEDMKPSIVISFIKDKAFKARKRFHSVHTIRENEDGEQLSDLLEFHFIELGKIDYLGKAVEELDALEQFGTYLRNAGNQDEEKLVNDLVEKGEKVIGMADKILLRVSEDDRIRAMRDSREAFQMQMSWEMRHAHEAGLAEGHAAGLTECARKMKSEGIDFSLINAVTGYSIAMIEAL